MNCHHCEQACRPDDLTTSTCGTHAFCIGCVAWHCKTCDECGKASLRGADFKHDSFDCNRCYHKLKGPAKVQPERNPAACFICKVAGGCEHGDMAGNWR